MIGFEALLRLQDHDTTIDQLEHRQAHLPEYDRVAAAARELADLDGEESRTLAQRDEIARNQKRIEDEVALVAGKADHEHERLYGGTVTAPKELQAMQADFDSLKRRQTELEDQVIEMMEEAEPVDEALSGLALRRTRVEAEVAAAGAALEAAQQAVAGELDMARDERAAIVCDVPPELLTAYDRLRPQYAGIAVARLVGTNCSGCHLSLSAMALDSIRKLPPDALATCDECGRILIR